MSRRFAMPILTTLATLCVACGETSRFSGSAPRTIEAFVPEGLAIHREYVAEFTTDDGPVRLTYVAYGSLEDCPSGCFSSFVCAIEDESDEELYYASWTPGAVGEIPLDFREQCPGDEVDPANGLLGLCEPIGKTHPVTLTAAFRTFAEDNAFSGPFRHCLGDYKAHGCLFSPCL